MNYTVGDVIELDGKSNVILTTIDDKGVNYSFVNELQANNEDVTDIYYVVKHNSDGTFTRMTDANEVNEIFPKIQEGLKQSMTDFGIDYKSILEQQGGE